MRLGDRGVPRRSKTPDYCKGEGAKGCKMAKRVSRIKKDKGGAKRVKRETRPKDRKTLVPSTCLLNSSMTAALASAKHTALSNGRAYEAPPLFHVSGSLFAFSAAVAPHCRLARLPGFAPSLSLCLACRPTQGSPALPATSEAAKKRIKEPVPSVCGRHQSPFAIRRDDPAAHEGQQDGLRCRRRGPEKGPRRSSRCRANRGTHAHREAWRFAVPRTTHSTARRSQHSRS